MRGLFVVVAVLAFLLSGCVEVNQPQKERQPGLVFGGWRLPEGSPAPVPLRDCTELLSTLNTRAVTETDALLDLSVERGTGHVYATLAGDMIATTATAAPMQLEAGSAADADVTGTNNQEAGVDEADILKTDGEWTYAAHGRYVYILHSERVGDAEHYARFDLGANHSNAQLLLEPRDPDDASDDRLIVISQSWSGYAYIADDVRGSSAHFGSDATRIQVLSLADRAEPRLLKEIEIEGNLAGARLVDGYAYVVVHAAQYEAQLQTWVYPTEEDLARWGVTWNEYHNLNETVRKGLAQDVAERVKEENRRAVSNITLDEYLPRVTVTANVGTPLELTYDDSTCGRFLTTPDATGRSVSTILSLDAAGAEPDHALTQILGSDPVVYGAVDALVLASSSRDPWWFWQNGDLDEATDLQWFDLAGLDVRHRASGRTVGTIIDSFAIDVHDETLRIATTTGQWGRWWMSNPEPMMNHLVVFESVADALVPVGIVGGIAPDERIWSARFTDDRAYIVTFEQVDPLWIIDLSVPTAPTILGEVEVPGVSTYIHPIADGLLLTVGYGPRGDGQGLDWGRFQVSLFDVSDPASAARLDVMDVGPGGDTSTWSGATQEHKAFTYWDRVGVLALPVTTYNNSPAEDGRWISDYHVGLELIDVDVAGRSLSRHGGIDQDSLSGERSEYYWTPEIERTYFLGFPEEGDVSVYSMSQLGITAHDLATMAEEASAGFDSE